ARAAAMLATVILTACSDWLIEQPQDFFPLNQFPQTEADLAIALGGIDNWYSGGSNQPYFIRGWPILTEVPSDQTITTQTSGARTDARSLRFHRQGPAGRGGAAAAPLAGILHARRRPAHPWGRRSDARGCLSEHVGGARG